MEIQYNQLRILPHSDAACVPLAAWLARETTESSKLKSRVRDVNKKCKHACLHAQTQVTDSFPSRDSSGNQQVRVEANRH